jgi:hypothetical protein
MFLTPVVLVLSASPPIAVLLLALLQQRALIPKAVLPTPVVLHVKAEAPTAVLPETVLLKHFYL